MDFFHQHGIMIIGVLLITIIGWITNWARKKQIAKVGEEMNVSSRGNELNGTFQKRFYRVEYKRVEYEDVFSVELHLLKLPEIAIFKIRKKKTRFFSHGLYRVMSPENSFVIIKEKNSSLTVDCELQSQLVSIFSEFNNPYIELKQDKLVFLEKYSINLNQELLQQLLHVMTKIAEIIEAHKTPDINS